MRQAAEDDLSGFDNFTSVNASAENTGLPDQSVDFVVAAQAYHWFDRQVFKRECQRILRPGGKVALISNIRNNKTELFAKDFAIRKKYSIGDAKGLGTSGTTQPDKPKKKYDFFIDNIHESKTFNNDLHYDRETFIGRNLSTSYAPNESQNPEMYHGLINELNALFDHYSLNGILTYPHHTKILIGMV
jgi:SAM-dependent methyltransferase